MSDLDTLPYTFEPPGERKRFRRYRIEELNRMTTMQLIDVCEREEIIHPAVHRLDKDALIHLVMQFRGSRTPHLILDETPGGQERLEDALKKAKRREISHNITTAGKIVAYRGLDTNFFDNFRLPYIQDLDDVNGVIVDSEDRICSIVQVRSYPEKKELYLTRSGRLSGRQAEIKSYRLVLFGGELSDIAYKVYTGQVKGFLPEIRVYTIPLLDFVVADPVQAVMPLAVDFGTSNTASFSYVKWGFGCSGN